MSYTTEEQIKVELASRGITGADNSAVIQEARDRTRLLSGLWDREDDKSAFSFLWGLVESILAGKEE